MVMYVGAAGPSDDPEAPQPHETPAMSQSYEADRLSGLSVCRVQHGNALRPFGGPLADSRASRSTGGGDPGWNKFCPAAVTPGPAVPAAADPTDCRTDPPPAGPDTGPPVAAPPPPAEERCCSLDARLTAVSRSPP